MVIDGHWDPLFFLPAGSTVDSDANGDVGGDDVDGEGKKGRYVGLLNYLDYWY